VKKNEIKVGGLYLAKVNEKVVTVRVDSIKDGLRGVVYQVTNLSTGRKTTFRSAAKFRAPAPEPKKPKVAKHMTPRGGEPAPERPLKPDEVEKMFEAKDRAEAAAEGAKGVPTPPFAEEPSKPTPKDKGPDTTLVSSPEGVGAKSVVPHPSPASAPRLQPNTWEWFMAAVEEGYGSDNPPPPDWQPERGKAPDLVPSTSPQKTTGITEKLKAESKASLAQHCNNAQPHVVVTALAGTGKTFTQIVGVAWAFGQQVWDKVVGRLGFDPEPSDEQRLVWDALALSRGAVATVTYCAFNKSIVNEFSEKWGWLVELLTTCGVTLQFATVNSLGNSAVCRSIGRFSVKDWHTENLLAKRLMVDPRSLRKEQPTLVSAVVELVGLCKLTLAGWTEEGGFDAADVTDGVLDEISRHYVIEVVNRERVYALVRDVLSDSLTPEDYGEMDFDDQNWIPVVRRLPVSKVDLLLVDEGQDLPRAKQEFARMMGRRIVLVGDVNQAIYGFAGADTDSIPRMMNLLGGSSGPVQPLLLTETRRCGHAIVEEARKIVPEFRAHPDNPPGIVRYQVRSKYLEEAEDKDMILSRTTAPVVSEALKSIKAGRKAVIRGRDFGKSLANFVEKFKAKDVPDLVSKVDDWLAKEKGKENAKRNPSENKLIALEDRRDCVMAFTNDTGSVQDVLNKIDLVFAGKQCPKCRKHYNETSESCYGCQTPLVRPAGLLFSTVHRAKGLEAGRVFLLRVKGAEMPHPMAKTGWQRLQEYNLMYVAVTRAINELVYVTDDVTVKGVPLGEKPR
jgi:hypothetical protein